jgi:hypothetical protein
MTRDLLCIPQDLVVPLKDDGSTNETGDDAVSSHLCRFQSWFNRIQTECFQSTYIVCLQQRLNSNQSFHQCTVAKRRLHRDQAVAQMHAQGRELS